MRRRFHGAGVLALCAAVLLSAACGTRLPDSAFQGESSSGSGGSGGTAANAASDVGVTATSIKVGMIDSVASILGPDTFSGPTYGAQAFFKALNAKGGVNGRTIEVVPCDDTGTGSGNVSCAHKLIDQDKVFAFAGNSMFRYDSAPYVSQKDVPDIGGEPISNAYDKYPHLYGIYGSDYPRDGSSYGWDNKLYSSTEMEHYAKVVLGAKTAAVVYYNQADSARYAQYEAQALSMEGFKVVKEQLDLFLANYGAAALDMRNQGVDVVFDTIDTGGNAQLCKAIDAAAVPIKAKITTVQSWDATVPTAYKDAPHCRNLLYANSSDANYEDTNIPAVADFRAAMAKYFPERESKLSEWNIEGWASAQWLTDAIASCGNNVTRSCVENFMNSGVPYDAHGIITPTVFQVKRPGETEHACFNVARWQDSAQGGSGGWVTQVPDMDKNCYDVPLVSYSP
jgi:branched-chain amino acid transport system substrate-binding protein